MDRPSTSLSEALDQLASWFVVRVLGVVWMSAWFMAALFFAVLLGFLAVGPKNAKGAISSGEAKMQAQPAAHAAAHKDGSIRQAPVKALTD